MTSQDEAYRAQEFVKFIRSVKFDCGEAGCWEWQKGRCRGYGRFSTHKVSKIAHRWIYELVHGPIDGGLVVRHKCDNPSCVNPMHLLVGSHKDNKQDSLSRGRAYSRSGSDHHNSKITEEIVFDIRRRAELGERYQRIAERHRLRADHVGVIVRRETWRHI